MRLMRAAEFSRLWPRRSQLRVAFVLVLATAGRNGLELAREKFESFIWKVVRAKAMSAIRNIASKSLKSKLVELIRLRGPLTVADYMKIVLTNPSSGFYMNEDVFGVKGHFTTNPEISQMFGEVLGAWLVQEWHRFGCPKPLRLVEFGPGRGTLMTDLIRTISSLERTASNSIQVRLIEMSPKLQEIQHQNFAKNFGKSKIVDKVDWFTHIDGIAEDREGFNAYIAHEFFDSLPIHKFIRDPKSKQWRELLVDYNQNEELRLCIASQPSLSSRLLIPENFQGDHIEVCPQAALQLERVTKQLNASKRGCMLICDYGFEDQSDYSKDEKLSRVSSIKPIISNRDTFRAFKDHDSWPPLSDPGEADLTADVDFGYLKNHLKDKAVMFGSISQRNFLLQCGLRARLDVLMEKANEEEKEDLISGAELMTEDMGDRYKFLALYPKGCEHLFAADPPAGFSACDQKY